MIMEGGGSEKVRSDHSIDCVSLVPRGTLQVRIPFMRQWSDPTLEQTNKRQIAREPMSPKCKATEVPDQKNILFYEIP